MNVLWHIFIPIILACIINFYIYSQGWNKNNDEKSKSLPPGYVIGIVWIIILGLLGYIHFLLYPSIESWFIVLTILYCLSYPFLTSGLKETNSKIYNIIALILAIIVFFSVFYKNKLLSLAAIPFLLWTLYVNIVLF
jgi:tryptophan-rich sensory protein